MVGVDADVIQFEFVRCHANQFCYVAHLLKDGLLLERDVRRHSLRICIVVQPVVYLCLAVLLAHTAVVGEFEREDLQFVGEDFLRLLHLELHCALLAGSKPVQVEVEETDAIDGFQAEVPLLVPSLYLTGEGAGDVVEYADGEMKADCGSESPR